MVLFDADKLKGYKIALGLSGGRDSMALAHAFLQAGVSFFAVNFEHGIRGENSLRDSEFVSKWCDDNGVRLMRYSFDAVEYADRNGLTVEQGAREYRYQIFDGLLADKQCDLVALAHHKNDQVETILMRILRGTGVRGLRGMESVRGGYIRPLIGVTRAQIDEYVRSNNILYVDDETNRETEYTRNYIRSVLDGLRERFPSLDDAVERLARNAAEVDDFVLASLPPPIFRDGEGYLPVSMLSTPILAKRQILILAEKLGVRQDIEERHYPLIFALAENENGKRIELPHGIVVHKDGKYLIFGKEKQIDDVCVSFADGVRNGIIEVSPQEKVIKGKGLFVDVDKIPDTAVLRYPRPNDRIQKFGGGTKNLGDFFTDKKIPLRNRKTTFVCAKDNSSNEILFVLGVDISSAVKVDDDTTSIVKITKK